MRGRKWVLAAIAVVVGVATGCSSSGGNSDPPPSGASSAPASAQPPLPQTLSTAHLACRFESILGIQFLIAQSSSGSASATLSQALQVAAKNGAKDLHAVVIKGLEADEKALRAGKSAQAVDIVQQTVSAQCNSRHDPVLTRAQLTALARIVSPDPSTVVARVRVFRPSH